MPELLQDINSFWAWLGLACLLLAVEVLIVPSGFFLCLGSAAAAVALLLFILPDISWLWASSIYACLAVLSIWLWVAIIRKRRAVRLSEQSEQLNMKTRQLIGYRAELTEAVKAGRGRIRVNDSPWMVEAEADYPAGTIVEVVDVKGITLLVKAI